MSCCEVEINCGHKLSGRVDLSGVLDADFRNQNCLKSIFIQVKRFIDHM